MRKFLLMSIVIGLLAVVPATADIFTVKMTSGTTFVTRYQPHQSDRHEDKILLLTEFGNWIALPKDAVESIASDTESKGFGTVLDSQTIALGWVPPSSQAATQSDASAAPADPTAQLIEFMRQQNSPAATPVYNNSLTVEPSQSSGIPIGLIGRP